MIHSAASLLLCCAEEGEVRLVDLIDALHNEGHSPEVLSGIDVETGMLTQAVDRISGPALFILCRTPELKPSAMRRLSGLFSARSGPQHRLITLDIRPGHTSDALREVRNALAETELGAGDFGVDVDEGNHLMRDVVGPTAFDALGVGAASRDPIPEPSVDAEQLARQLHAGMLEAEASLPSTSGASRPTPSRPVYPAGANLPAMGHVPQHEIERSTEPLEVTLERSASGSAAGIPRPVVDEEPVRGKEKPRESLEAAKQAMARAADAAAEASGKTDLLAESGARLSSASSASRPLRRPTPAPQISSIPREEPDDEPLPDEPTPSELDLARPRLRGDAAAAASGVRPRGRLLLVLSAAGMLALLAMAVMHVASGPDEASGRGVPGANAKAPATADAPGTKAAVPAAGGGPTRPATPTSPTPTPTPTPTPAAADDDGAGDEAADADGGPVVADTKAAADGPAPNDDGAGDGEGGADADDGAGDDAATTAGDDAAVPDPTPSNTPPTPALPTPTAGDDDGLDVRLAADIDEGRVDIVGHLYLLTKTSKQTTTWDDADRICRGRSISGVGGWRLPTQSQANKLRKAGKLERASYWTSTKVGSDEMVAYDGGTGRTTVWLKVEPNAQPVCVRKRK